MHCLHCGESFWGARSCLLRACPNCYEKWAATEAKRASWRVWMGMHKLYWQYGIRARLMHCVFSVRYDGQTLQECRNQAMTVLKDHGLEGGLLVFHPFRQDDDGDFALDGTVHFHGLVAAVGDIKPGSTEFYEDGIFFKVIPDPIRGGFRGFTHFGELRRCVQYLLTHCGVIEGRHTVTWYGSMSYNKLSQKALEAKHPKAVKDMEKVRSSQCPHCGSYDTERCEVVDYTRWSDRHSVQLHPYPSNPPPSPRRDSPER